MTAADVEEWDEWEDDDGSTTTPSSDAHDAKAQTRPTNLDPSSINAGEWGFDLTELEHEISNLSPSTCLAPFSVTDDSVRKEEKLLSLLNDLPTALQNGGRQLHTLQALTLVARLHVEAARDSFPELQSDTQATAEQLEGFKKELQQLAGEWGDKKLLKSTLMVSERQQLEEMSGLLHSALSTENEDLTLFQEVIEQLFAGMEEQKVILSTNWLKGGYEEDSREKTESYLDQILAIHSEEPTNSSRMPTLSEAEIFQDAKDVKRDELLVNGVKVEGTRGYDAVVDALQHELEHVLARQVGKTPEQTPMAVSNALQSVAMAVLHASNRTESGGCSYELLSKFLNNHEMDRVLLRPDSARAAPLEVHMDVGPYLEVVPGSKELTWAFGLRVKLLAVTWYLVCDAEDPTNELYEVETTFCNRLAFPVGLTPFHSLDNMRKDRGDVAIRLVLPTSVPTPASPRQE